MKNNLLVKFHNRIDGILKFPNLKKGKIGIQIGFDMSSPNLTTDLWIMCKKVGKTGKVIGIDPDITNHNHVKPIIEKAGYNVSLVNKGTSNRKTDQKLILAKRASWNMVEEYDSKNSNSTSENTVEVELDTLDNIIQTLSLKISDINHVNITNNGAEYHTLEGMKKLLRDSTNLSLTVIAGRSSAIGKVNGELDYEVITKFLTEFGFKTKFYRMSQLVWWGLFHQLLLKRKWVYGKNPYGVIMASKQKIKWYQSFS